MKQLKQLFLVTIAFVLVIALGACDKTEKDPISSAEESSEPKHVEKKDGVGPTGNEIRAINLGGWFVLERWMTPRLFEDSMVVGSDETDFVTQAENAKEKLEEHWSTFITQEDMYWIRDNGITHVRIPIPWWLFGEGAKASDYIDFDALPTETEEQRKHKEYLKNTKEYIRSVEYLDKAMDMAEKADLKVMLDLHTAPGGQNGFDNGGITNVAHWGRGDSMEKTIEILTRIAERYKDHPALFAIEILNEPTHWSLDRNDAKTDEDRGIKRLQAFSLEAYHALREIVSEDIYIIISDGFWTDAWINFFKENDLKNVALDIHRYQCFTDEDNRRSFNSHLMLAEYSRANEIKKMQQYVNIFVGEWSLGLPSPNNKRHHEEQYADAQLIGMKEAWGWSFWSYKIEQYNSGWNFRSLVERKILKPEMWTGETE